MGNAFVDQTIWMTSLSAVYIGHGRDVLEVSGNFMA